MTESLLLLVASITWLAVISPGADFAIVTRNSATFGRKAGLSSSLGIAGGCWVHIAYAMVGLAVILETVPAFFTYVQMAGAAYLIYVGISTIRSGRTTDTDGDQHQKSAWYFLGSGFLTNSLNPKCSVFMVSLYSQVVSADVGWTEQLVLGLFVSLSHFIWFSLVSLFFSAEGTRRVVMKRQTTINFVIGAVLILLGALLLFHDVEIGI